MDGDPAGVQSWGKSSPRLPRSYLQVRFCFLIFEPSSRLAAELGAPPCSPTSTPGRLSESHRAPRRSLGKAIRGRKSVGQTDSEI